MHIFDHITLKPDISFFDEEERSGYLVTVQRKKIWAVEIDLLAEFDRVCKKYDIHYCVFAGTLLGAVRHQGFIPWDDDLDVCLPRDEFERFLKVSKNEFKPPYFLQSALSDKKYFCAYARLRNSETTGLLSWTPSPEYNSGIFMDIYCMDGYLGRCFKSKMQFFQKKAIRMCLNAYYADLSQCSFKKKILYLLLKNTICSWASYEKLYKAFVNTVSRYNQQTKRYADSSASTMREMDLYSISTDDFTNTATAKFEYCSVPIPKNYKQILRNMFGNYMEFPPLDKVDEWHGNMITFDPDIFPSVDPRGIRDCQHL